jgi:hypothetical protein
MHLESQPPLYAISVFFDPYQTAFRRTLFERFVKKVSSYDISLIVVELAFGDRPFEVTESGNPNHVQLRAGVGSEFFIKGALVNRGFQRLASIDRAWRKAVWIDGDVAFLRDDWVEKTLSGLDHYAVLQPWSNSIDLGPDYEVVTNEWGHDVDKSFGAAFVGGDGMFQDPNLPEEGYGRGDWRAHAGYAWAIRRETFDGIGGVIDWMVTGNEDYMMAMGFSGKLRAFIIKEEQEKKRTFTAGYKRRLLHFADLCDRHVKRNLGYVPGTLCHGWHGRKGDRGYLSRVKINELSSFCPDTHLVYDSQGIPLITDENLALRDLLRKWMKSRCENATEVEPRDPAFVSRNSPRW